MYQPNHAVNLEGSNSKAELNQNQMPTQQQQPPQQGISQPKPNGKVESKNKINEPSQEQQIYVVDGDDEADVNDEAMQIRNLYGLLSRYSQNEI
jgi:hypothetical protein